MKQITKEDWIEFFPFAEPRKEQIEAINFALNSIINDKKRFLLLELGLGIGKSATGITIGKYLSSIIDRSQLGEQPDFFPGTYVLTVQKILQEQYINDFDNDDQEMRSIKSSSNYQCNFFKHQSCGESLRVLNSAWQTLRNTQFGHKCSRECEYKKAKKEFIDCELSVTNYSYFLAETMYAGKIEPRETLVIDECLRGDAKIWINDKEEVTIREIYENPEITHVISFNQSTNSYEKKRIMRRIRTEYDANTDWIKIEVGFENQTSELIVTSNHKIWTANRGYVRADELQQNDVLKYDVLQKQDITHRFSGKRAIKPLLKKRKEIHYTCEICDRVFETEEFKRHKNSIIEIRECKTCQKKFEITKSTGYKRAFCSNACYHNSDEIRQQRSTRLIQKNPMSNDVTRQKMKDSWRKNWNSKSEEEKIQQITRFKNAPLHEKRFAPNKLEQFVIDLGHKNVKFTGLGDKWVTFKCGKHKNPDFVIEGTNKVIEIGDTYFWHSEDEIAQIVQKYAEIGYECLYVTNKEIDENEDIVRLKISKFVNNHDVIVKSITKLDHPRHFKSDKSHFKYNIEVEDNHNYFANSILVSNCHNIETELGKFIELPISQNFAETILGIEVPDIKTATQLHEWLKSDYHATLTAYIAKLQKQLNDKLGRLNKKKLESIEDPALAQIAKKYEAMDKHICKLNRFLGAFSESNWIVSFEENSSGGRVFRLKPIDVSPFSEDHLFKYGRYVVLMSATILDKEAYCKSIGVPLDQVAFLHIDSPFAPEKRPVYYMPVGKMSANELDKNLPKIVEAVKEILAAHPAEKGIIHTANHKIATYLNKNILNSRLLFHKDADQKTRILKEHLETSDPTVLVSPSMNEGVDLSDDLSRFQIFCKVPYPYLGDEIVKIRMQRNPAWYSAATARNLIQATGRSVRNSEDFATTYIIDQCFDDFLKRNKKIFPKSFLDALK